MGEIRLGKISSINCTDGTARVAYPDRNGSVTQEIPFLSSEYNMPSIGDMVLVVHLSNGSDAGVILGRPWSDKNKPPESGGEIYRKDLCNKKAKQCSVMMTIQGCLILKQQISALVQQQEKLQLILFYPC